MPKIYYGLLFMLCSACSDKVPELPSPVINGTYNASEQAVLQSALFELDRRCYNVFSKPNHYSALSARMIDAAPEEAEKYGWARVAEISFTLDKHRDYGTAIGHNCSFRIGDGHRPGVNGKSTCMEYACKMQPLEPGAAWGLFSPTP